MDSISAQSKTDMGETQRFFFRGAATCFPTLLVPVWILCIRFVVWDFPFFTFFGASGPDGSDPIRTGICTRQGQAAVDTRRRGIVLYVFVGRDWAKGATATAGGRGRLMFVQ